MSEKVLVEEEQAVVLMACIDGLMTDGAHHKQWYLEKILRLMLGDVKYEKFQAAIKWEKGIAP